MLEEALKDPSRNPADTAQAMRIFISQDLPIGGTATGDRFFHQLYTPLCTRVFGEMADSKGEFKHEPGGWLSVQNRWRPTPSSMQSSSTAAGVGMSRSVPGRPGVTPSIDADPVVQLLGPKKVPPPKPGSKNANSSEAHMRSIIETLEVEMVSRSGIYFPFPFQALPASIQRQFVLVLEQVVVNGAANNPNQQQHHQMNHQHAFGMNVVEQVHNEQGAMSQNAYRLFTELLLVNPEGQVQVKAYQQKKLHEKNFAQPLQLSPGLASPQSRTPISPTNMTSPIPEQKEDVPKFLLSALEYYLFLFIRYPLASPFIPRQTSSQPGVNRYQVVNRSRTTSPYGEIVYRNLFNRYLEYYLPHTPYPPAEAEFPPSKATSEMFLRIVITFWLESQVVIPTTTKAVHAIRERFRRTGIQHEPSVDLKMSYDLAFGKYSPLPSLAQQCLKNLTIHLLKDPTIYHSVMDHSRNWCLSQAMTALQQPFYNYVRSSFRHASIHAQGSAFYSAMNAWLIWLEPWNVNHSKASNASTRLMNSIPGKSSQITAGPSMIIPKGDKKSSYNKSWEPYLAANLFLYTVPLAIFLRRARELDFSPREFYRSLDLLKRVFRVYTPEVIQALTNLTANIKNPSPGSSNITKTVENHRGLLGEFAPSTIGELSLVSCQNDMQGLLEEMNMQHTKRVRDLGYIDKFAAYIEGIFNHGVVSGEEMAIKTIVERATVIVGFPIGYEILSSEANTTRGTRGATVESSEIRTSQGLLTEEGRQQVLTGQLKCSPADVHYVGDKMQARLRTYEIAVLVTLTNFLSRWLNERFGLLPPTQDNKASPKKQTQFQKNLQEQDAIKGFRFDLRWFADYRNLCFALFVTFLFSRTVF